MQLVSKHSSNHGEMQSLIPPLYRQITVCSFAVVLLIGSAAVAVAAPTFSDTSAAAASPVLPPVVPLLERTEVRDDVGQYALSYLTGDGIAVAEQGALKPTADGQRNVLVKQGSYAYVGDDGRTYTVHYVADENGYRAFGDHLPVAPVDEAAVAAQQH